MSEETQTTTIQQNTSDYKQPDESIIRIRLDPSDVIDRYEENLRGGRWQTVEIDGTFKDIFVSTRQTRLEFKPECIDTVMRWLRTYLNPHTFQGNINIEQYNQFMQFLIQDMACAFFDHAHEWQISGRTANMMINELTSIATLTLTRALDDLERKHLGEGVKVNEHRGTQGQAINMGKQKFGGF